MSPAWVHVALAILGFILSGAIAVWRVSWVVSTSYSKMKEEFAAEIASEHAKVDAKIGKVWERFDTYKNTCDNTFVRQQTCTLIHNGNDKTLAEINRRQESMEKKLDALIVAIVQKQEV